MRLKRASQTSVNLFRFTSFSTTKRGPERIKWELGIAFLVVKCDFMHWDKESQVKETIENEKSMRLDF